MNYIIESKNITFSNGYSLSLEYPIQKALVINNVIIILIEPPFEVIYNENVFAFTVAGDFLWRLDKVKLFYQGQDKCPYVEMEINKQNELVLYNWCDTGVVVNPQSGDVIRIYQTK